MKDSKTGGYIYGVSVCGLLGATVLILFPDSRLYGYIFFVFSSIFAVAWGCEEFKWYRKKLKIDKERSELDELFFNLGLGINGSFPRKVGNPRITDNCVEYTFTLPAGISISRILRDREAIEEYIGSRVDVEYRSKRMFVIREHKNQPVK